MRRFILLFLLYLSGESVYAQYSYGTTGLLNMPTADMQRDKTFMCGGGYLEKHASVARWFYDTFNYYMNITIFPWLEVCYDMILVKGVEKDPEKGGVSYWVPSTYGKFCNQDRAFHARLRLWKEGWWKPWTPQVVIGMDDFLSASWAGMSLSSNGSGNGFSFREYISISKHYEFKNIGVLGGHITYLYNGDKRWHSNINGLAVGTNFRFNLPEDGGLLNTFLNGWNVMAEAYPMDGKGTYWVEYDGINHYKRGLSVGVYDINVGFEYALPLVKSKLRQEDALSIHFFGELYGCKDFSGGVQFKVHLK